MKELMSFIAFMALGFFTGVYLGASISKLPEPSKIFSVDTPEFVQTINAHTDACMAQGKVFHVFNIAKDGYSAECLTEAESNNKYINGNK